MQLSWEPAVMENEGYAPLFRVLQNEVQAWMILF